MSIYLVCNNQLSNNIVYKSLMDIEDKKKHRPLTCSGYELSKKILIPQASLIYSSSYLSCIETAKSLSENCNINITIDKKLDDCLVGDLGSQSLKMLSYFQEHDFDYKLIGGESINEVCLRINNVINKLQNLNEEIVIFMPRKSILSYLTKYSITGFNLDERLVLTKNDNIIMDSSEDDIEIFKLDFINDDVLIEKKFIGDNNVL